MKWEGHHKLSAGLEFTKKMLFTKISQLYGMFKYTQFRYSSFSKSDKIFIIFRSTVPELVNYQETVENVFLVPDSLALCSF
jgi:hypothetical protein